MYYNAKTNETQVAPTCYLQINENPAVQVDSALPLPVASLNPADELGPPFGVHCPLLLL